jgi:GNAT superfamily N-acetyltransferase
MEFISFDSPSDFLAVARPALEERESANNLMYGLALRLESNPARFQAPPYRWPPLLAAVRDGLGLAAAALMTPPFNLTLFSPRPDKAEVYAFLGQALAEAGWSPPGVLAPAEDARTFAEAWSSLSGAPYRAGLSERVYELRQVIFPEPRPPGKMRRATESTVEQVARWLYAFWQEALPSDAGTLQDARWNAEARIEDGDYFIWEDLRQQPVAMAARTRPTPHGCCICPVYTPPEQRTHGYASALTAALSQRLLRQGYQFTALFTNLANPISNSIYQKIGYVPVCDFNEYLFG